MKNFKKALGSVGGNLFEIMEAVVKTNDLAATGQIKNLKEIFIFVQNAVKEGLPPEFAMSLISAFIKERAVYTSGEVEMAGSASTGFETAEGNSLNLSLDAGGSLAGFALKAGLGYQNHSDTASFERSTQNFRILARWTVVPSDTPKEILQAMSAFVAKPTPGAEIPGLPESFESPYLDALKDFLPEISKMLKKNED